jgi:putative polyhydroxyalkanoate system protein
MRIQRNHELGKSEARKRVDEVSDELCARYGLRAAWEGDSLRLNGSGVNACIAVSEQSVDVEVRLGFMLLMMESAIRTSIEDALDAHLL